jgi:hypothetical protein
MSSIRKYVEAINEYGILTEMTDSSEHLSKEERPAKIGAAMREFEKWKDNLVKERPEIDKAIREEEEKKNKRKRQD